MTMFKSGGPGTLIALLTAPARVLTKSNFHLTVGIFWIIICRCVLVAFSVYLEDWLFRILTPFCSIFGWSTILYYFSVLAVIATFDQFFLIDTIWRLLFGKEYASGYSWVMMLPHSFKILMGDTVMAVIG